VSSFGVGVLMQRLRATAFALGLAFASALSGCGSEDHVVERPQAQSGDLPSQEVKDFSLEESDTGTPEWILTSAYAATYDRRGVILARGVAIDFFDSKGEKYSHLTAREGEIKRPSNDMEARGDVKVTTTDGVRIQTESLRFLNREGKIVSDQFVRLERNGDVVTGIGFESDPSLEHFAIKREVKAQVQSGEKGGLKFRQRGTP
jgi:LPS export ABC transporter protein LptC